VFDGVFGWKPNKRTNEFKVLVKFVQTLQKIGRRRKKLLRFDGMDGVPQNLKLIGGINGAPQNLKIIGTIPTSITNKQT
jgi:hypothetical protein